MPLMMNVNFSDDSSYRYKMEIPILRWEGAGNGMQTIFENLTSIATALKREPEELAKYFEFTLGSIQLSKEDSTRFAFTGKHDMETVTKILKTFIFNTVLCKYCGNPETEHTILETKIVSHCKACGKHFDIMPLGVNLKLVSWLIKRKFPQEQRKRKLLQPVQIVNKLSKICEQPEILQKQINEFVEQQ